MTLSQQRVLFTHLISRLVLAGTDMGYHIAYDQIRRTYTEAQQNVAKGIGIVNSLHIVGLAADLLLYEDAGGYLVDSTAYRELGKIWKSYDPLCCWGGDFTKQDPGHFSMTWQGVK